MKPNARFFLVSAFVFGVPLCTFLCSLVLRLDLKHPLARAIMVIPAHLGLIGLFLMYPVGLLDSAMFGGAHFNHDMFGYSPRGTEGWALYLSFYLIVAMLAGSVARVKSQRASGAA